MDARYTDTVVEAHISQAERWINEYCGQSFTGTIPDGVTYATIELAKYFMDLQQLEDAHLEELQLTFDVVVQLIKDPLEKHKVSPSYGDSTGFNLRVLGG